MPLGYLLVSRPYLLAHRGASAYAPENTFSAFDRAIALRSHGIETDVRATSDGVLMLLHDPRVDRTTDGEGVIAQMTAAEVAALDAGIGFNPRFRGERVPRLDEFLRRYGRRLPLCLELKSAGIAESVVALVRDLDLLDDLPPADAGGRESIALPAVTFTSFDFATCEELHRIAPRAYVGFLTAAWDRGTIERVAAAGLAEICPRADACRGELVEAARDRRLAVRAWGVGDREVLRQALRAGVDGVTCDWPDWTLSPTL